MIYLFGSTGMLGNYVKKVLSYNNYDITYINREQYNVLIDCFGKLNTILSNCNENDIIINCIGLINQKANASDIHDYIKINTLFPHKLNEIAKKYKSKLIHITTDCVFDGVTGNYNENSKPNSNEIYGISKLLGEPEDCTIIRTSIIGHEIKHKKSLLEWVISKKNGKINGYTNHFWNGVTCLKLANIIMEIIKKNLFWNGIRHIYSSNNISKYELCCIINDIYKLNINIEETQHNNCINRVLNSNFEIPFVIPNIKEQIIEQKNFE